MDKAGGSTTPSHHRRQSRLATGEAGGPARSRARHEGQQARETNDPGTRAHRECPLAPPTERRGSPWLRTIESRSVWHVALDSGRPVHGERRASILDGADI